MSTAPLNNSQFQASTQTALNTIRRDRNQLSKADLQGPDGLDKDTDGTLTDQEFSAAGITEQADQAAIRQAYQAAEIDPTSPLIQFETAAPAAPPAEPQAVAAPERLEPAAGLSETGTVLRGEALNQRLQALNSMAEQGLQHLQGQQSQLESSLAQLPAGAESEAQRSQLQAQLDAVKASAAKLTELKGLLASQDPKAVEQLQNFLVQNDNAQKQHETDLTYTRDGQDKTVDNLFGQRTDKVMQDYIQTLSSPTVAAPVAEPAAPVSEDEPVSEPEPEVVPESVTEEGDVQNGGTVVSPAVVEEQPTPQELNPDYQVTPHDFSSPAAYDAKLQLLNTAIQERVQAGQADIQSVNSYLESNSAQVREFFSLTAQSSQLGMQLKLDAQGLSVTLPESLSAADSQRAATLKASLERFVADNPDFVSKFWLPGERLQQAGGNDSALMVGKVGMMMRGRPEAGGENSEPLASITPISFNLNQNIWAGQDFWRIDNDPSVITPDELYRRPQYTMA